MVRSAAATGRSITLPRVSPDGRWLVCCVSDYSCFPTFRPSSDLYIIDLSSLRGPDQVRWRRLEACSPRAESWHSWSSNGRWLAFSSKRLDGLFAHTYLTYIDTQGRAHAPFIVPERDPTANDRTLRMHTLPELIAEPVPLSSFALGRAARQAKPATDTPAPAAPQPEPSAGAPQS
jgi:dipeptidyl aminopeptidase/acylaminoacyl peptidase